jgi:hypothetical protein
MNKSVQSVKLWNIANFLEKKQTVKLCILGIQVFKTTRFRKILGNSGNSEIPRILWNSGTDGIVRYC